MLKGLIPISTRTAVLRLGTVKSVYCLGPVLGSPLPDRDLLESSAEVEACCSVAVLEECCQCGGYTVTVAQWTSCLQCLTSTRSAVQYTSTPVHNCFWTKPISSPECSEKVSLDRTVQLIDINLFNSSKLPRSRTLSRPGRTDGRGARPASPRRTSEVANGPPTATWSSATYHCSEYLYYIILP